MSKRKLGGFGLGAPPRIDGCDQQRLDTPERRPIDVGRSNASRGCSSNHSAPAKVTMHADMHHTHLMHIPLARLYAGMVDALACTQTNHTRHTGHGRSRSTANLARHSLLSFRILLSTQESLAASHKCHFCVRRFGRVFALPYNKGSCWSVCRSSVAALLGVTAVRCGPCVGNTALSWCYCMYVQRRKRAAEGDSVRTASTWFNGAFVGTQFAEPWLSETVGPSDQGSVNLLPRGQTRQGSPLNTIVHCCLSQQSSLTAVALSTVTVQRVLSTCHGS
jgi:hypothetical protein